MDQITEIEVEPLSESRYIKPYRVRYTQKGNRKLWDCIRMHDSVAVLLYNSTRDALVLVSQFRPAVYMSSNKQALENCDLFKNNSLRMKSSQEEKIATPKPPSSPSSDSVPQFGPGSEGVTYELCAGIVDKQASLEQIAKEEVLEETGYDVPMDSLRRVNDFWSNIGTGGSNQVLYYCEVTDDMLTTAGGGMASEGELIDVFYLPVSEAREFLFDSSKKKSMGLCFGFMWFLETNNKAFKQ